MTEEELFEKYNVVHVDGCRYYIVNLGSRSYDFENTTPFCITICEVTIFAGSWKNLIPRIVEELDSKAPKSRLELLNISCPWSKQCVFGETKKSNFVPYKDVYINANHTALHSMWIIQLLLKEYNIDIDKCEFVIKRAPSAEPNEIKSFFEEKTLKGFKSYLQNDLKKSEKSIDNILKNISFINSKILSNISSGYTNLFLIEDPSYFYSYSKKIVDYLMTKGSKKDTIDTVSRQLNYLYDFTKITNKENRLKYSNYHYSSKEKENKELKDFLDDFDSLA